MREKRYSELQNYIIFILGENQTAAAIRKAKMVWNDFLKKNRKKGKTFGDFFRNAKLSRENKASFNSSDLRLSIIDFREHLMDVVKYSNENSAQASISRSMKNLLEKKLIKIHDLGGQKYLSLTVQGYKRYECLKNWISPYIGLYENFKEDPKSPIM